LGGFLFARIRGEKGKLNFQTNTNASYRSRKLVRNGPKKDRCAHLLSLGKADFWLFLPVFVILKEEYPKAVISILFFFFFFFFFFLFFSFLSYICICLFEYFL